MKRYIMVLAVMFGLFTASNAQTYIGNMSDDIMGVVPSYFSSSGHPYLLYYYEDYKGIIFVIIPSIYFSKNINMKLFSQ